MLELPQLCRLYAQHAGQPAVLNTEVKKVLAGIDPECLPLQQGLQHSSVALPEKLEFTLLGVNEEEKRLNFTVVVFYRGIVAGCSCSDDPTPTDSVMESCEIEIGVRRDTGEAGIRLLQD